jgi:uncharacterized protein (TIGR00255 family)
MESMTGYGTAEGSNNQFSFTVEVKSLNSKYLEVYVNTPRVLSSEETTIDRRMREIFSRGKVECNVEIVSWSEVRPMSINRDLLIAYYRELVEIHEELSVPVPLPLEPLLRLDGVTQREKTLLREDAIQSVISAVEKAGAKALAMRKKEGKALKKDIVSNVTLFQKHMKNITALSKKNSDVKRKQLSSRLETLSGGTIDDQRLFTEIAILADKLDINEELVRLGDHITKMKELFSDHESVGKKIDFMAQEFFREVNTIGSKSASSEVSHEVVEMKNIIDKIREQGRNIC